MTQIKSFNENWWSLEYGDGNTLVVALNIHSGSFVADVINKDLDVLNGVVNFTQRPGETVDDTLRNWGHEVTLAKDNIVREADVAAENVKREVSHVAGPGVYTKVDSHNVEVGPVHLHY